MNESSILYEYQSTAIAAIRTANTVAKRATLQMDKAPLSVDNNAQGSAELAVAAAVRADGSNMRAIAVPQHLHAVVAVVGYKDVTRTVKGKPHGVRKLAVA